LGLIYNGNIGKISMIYIDNIYFTFKKFRMIKEIGD
jgi:hypothetical protein